MRIATFLIALAIIPLSLGCGRHDTSVDDSNISTVPPSVKIEKPGLHQVYRVTDKLLSGGSPDGEKGFASLKELGVQSIISVDGANPDVAGARQFGLQYVHLPIGYDGISRPQALRLAKAVRELPGIVYIHCHHGKHRGPAAASVIRLCLDSSCSVEQAINEMKQAGTDPRYKGLYDASRSLIRPTLSELDQLSADFPEVTAVSRLAQSMVEIDGRFDNLSKCQSAGWSAPKNNPDLDPPHEALMLAELYREAARSAPNDRHAVELRELLNKAEQQAIQLEKTLRFAKPSERANADDLLKQIKSSCVRCHEKYRDVGK